jgi:hypothetical protein
MITKDDNAVPGRDRHRVDSRDHAIDRIVAEIYAGLQHGYFEYAVSCEVIGHGRRRVVLHAGKNFQFVISADECAACKEAPRDSRVAP